MLPTWWKRLAMPSGRPRHRAASLVQALLFLCPSLVFLMLFTYLPIARALVVSVTSSNLASGHGDFVGVSNYVALVGDPVFWHAVVNNAWYTLGTVVPSMALGLLFAVLLNRQVYLRGFYRLSLFYPSVLPTAAASMIWVFLFNPSYGAVNQVISRLGISSGIDWLNAVPCALVAIILVGIWKHVGYYMLFFLAGLQSIDPSLYEAAEIEGANGWQRFWSVTFPLLTPTTFMVAVVAVVDSFQAVDQVYVMTRGGPFNTTNVLMYYIYQKGFLFWELGLASAASVFVFTLLILGTILYFALLSRRVVYER